MPALYCYWPKNDCVGRAKRHELPDKEKWNFVPVRVFECSG